MSILARIDKTIQKTSYVCWRVLHAHQSSYFVGGIFVGLLISVSMSAMDPRLIAVFAGTIVLFVFVVATFGRLAEKSGSRILDREKHYRDFFDNAIEGIFRTTPSGHYIAVNHALARIYGYPSRDELSNVLTNIASQLYVDPNRRNEFKAIMDANDRVTDFVSEIRRRDGTTIWISENARAVRDWSGHIVCYEGTVEDVTDRVVFAQRLQKALHEAEEVNRAKGAFLATMSHELRTPLNAIIGFSEIIKDQVLGLVQPQAYRDYAGDIHNSGVRLLAIINDILDASRLESGSIAIDQAPNEIRRLIDNAIKAARQMTDDTHEITVVADPGLPEFLVDSKRFCQCITKVLSNAMKFAPDGGMIMVCVGLGEDGGLSLSIKDTGIGMDPEKLANVAQPFHQLDGSLSRRYEGIGLGLFIAKALIELHGGTLDIESAKNQGTTVTFLLPPSCTLMHSPGGV